jgi:hypothetical protein
MKVRLLVVALSVMILVATNMVNAGETSGTNANSTTITHNQMVDDIVNVWTIWLDENGAPPADKRRKNLSKYANELADAIEVYQSDNSDVDSQLPKERTTHILLATMVTLESSINPTKVGKKRNEVGMLQIHGGGLAGYSRNEVKRSSALGLMLGVRWLALMVRDARPSLDKIRTGKWKTRDWLLPLSLYASGPEALDDKGNIVVVWPAKRRLGRAQMYMARLKN